MLESGVSCDTLLFFTRFCLVMLSVSAGVVTNQGLGLAQQGILHERYPKGQCSFIFLSQFQADIQQTYQVSLGFLKRQCCRVFKYSLCHSRFFLW